MIAKEDRMHYLAHQGKDELWGLVCTTVGKQTSAPHSLYPSLPHPEKYLFPGSGRTLDEYQLVYITSGKGYFWSKSCPRTKVSEGDMIIVFPGEEHEYCPEEETGWTEIWVGFRGDSHLDTMIGNFFSRQNPVLPIGSSDTVFDIYGRILYLANSDKLGSQQAIGGFIYALLGYIYHKIANASATRIKNLEKIQKAQILLREDLSAHISPSEIASQLGMSYSLLRDQFKTITGMSMAEYSLNQRMNHAKTLLTSSDKSIKEIAFETGYESVSRFCCAFKQYVGITASEFRNQNRHSSGMVL